ncbi:protein EDS1-like isoform X2 [Castanea sativa]|uniref:protein EDS1-like isoform X2 n=1 Tax=Castanea sativa TaxID=21020 RepID=UPI003F64E3CE
MASLNLGENIEINTELIKKAYSLAVKAHSKSLERAYYVEGRSHRSSNPIIFSFSGCWSENGWYDGEPFGATEINLPLLFPSLRSIGVNENALVNKAFLQRFVDKILGNSDFDREVQKAVKENKQILFTGHSSGGSTANLATIWFLEKCLKSKYNYKISPSSPLCVTFGCPLTGNHIFSHSLRRENWARYFIHFVMRYDIVPRIMLAPISSIKLEFQKVLQFLNAKSVNLARASIDTFDASNFYMRVMKNASSVLCHEEECTDIAHRSLQQHFGYENDLQESFQMLNEVYLEPLEQLPLSSDSTISDIATINSALNDLGLSTRARLCLCAAGELEKRKTGNKESIDLKKPDIEKAMKYLEEGYRSNCENRGLGCYDAFKLQETHNDFNANVKRLELAGIWDEIIEMLKRYELPDAFEGLRDWVLLGTRYRRLVEPLDIANYYRHLKNEDTGAYMIRGRPKRYRFTQRWREHAEKMPVESSGESCF